MSEEMVTMCFVAPAAMKLELEAWAKAEDRSVSSLLRLILEPPLDARRRTLELALEQEREQAQRQAALAQVGAPRTSVAGSARAFEE